MTTQKTSSVSVILAYIVIYFVWGSTFFFIEKALNSFPPFVLGSIRFIIASSLLMGYCAIRGYKLFNKEDIKTAAFVGFLLLFVDMAAVIWSEQFISSAIVSIISAAAAIWFIVFDKPKWKENFGSIPIILGLVLGFTGVVLLFAEQIFAGDPHADKRKEITAMVVMTLGTVGWTLGSLFSKYFQSKKPSEKEGKQEEGLNVIVKTAWQMATAGVAFTTVALLSGEYSKFEFDRVPGKDWFAIGYLITMGSILAFSCYIWLLQVRPATEVSTYAYINPIVAMILAHFFTDHHVTKLQIFGLLIVLFSVLLMNWNLYKNNRTFRVIRARKKLKLLRNMAPKSSIPRIIEVANFEEESEEHKEEHKEQMQD